MAVIVKQQKVVKHALVILPAMTMATAVVMLVQCVLKVNYNGLDISYRKCFCGGVN